MYVSLVTHLTDEFEAQEAYLLFLKIITQLVDGIFDVVRL